MQLIIGIWMFLILAWLIVCANELRDIKRVLVAAALLPEKDQNRA